MSSKPYAERIRQHRNLKMHLGELGALTGRSVEANELSSAEQASLVRNSEKKFSEYDVMSVDILFSDIESFQFKNFIKQLYDKNNSPVQVWLPRTIDCGILEIDSILDVRFNFNFNLNEEGILVLMTQDMEDKLLLDWFKIPDGEERLKIETQGVNWSKVLY